MNTRPGINKSTHKPTDSIGEPVKPIDDVPPNDTDRTDSDRADSEDRSIARDSRPEDEDDEETQIVSVQRTVVGDQVVEKKHGPMPVSQWAKYEKKHNL